MVELRRFSTGATRDVEGEKLDFEGFMSPLVVERYAQYLHKHRVQSDGTKRPSDNWQLGFPLDACMKSAFRHFHDWWKQHRKWKSAEDIEDSICAVIFNASAYLHERLKARQGPKPGQIIPMTEEEMNQFKSSQMRGDRTEDQSALTLLKKNGFSFVDFCQEDPTGVP